MSRRAAFWVSGLVAVAVCAVPFAIVGTVRSGGGQAWAWRSGLRAEATVARTARVLQLARERDAARAIPYRDGVTTVIRPGVADSVRSLVERVLPDAIADARLAGPGVPVVVWVIPETSLVVRDGGSEAVRTILAPTAVTPQAFDGRRCLVLYPVKRQDQGPVMTRAAFERSAPAAVCGFYARYGMPGAGTTAWLAATRYQFASSGVAPDDRAGAQAGRWRWERSALYALGAVEYAPDAGVLAVRCVTRADASCEAAIAPQRRLGGGLLPAGYVVGPLEGDRFVPTRVPPSLMARIERAVGPEQFAALWQADDPFPQAVRRVTGRSLGSFAADAMRLPAGAAVQWHQPWVPAGTAAIALGVVAAALGVAIVTAPRTVDP